MDIFMLTDYSPIQLCKTCFHLWAQPKGQKEKPQLSPSLRNQIFGHPVMKTV